MSKETILILISILSTPLLGALVSNYFARRKTSAETQNLNITGEINIGESWQKYAFQQQKDKEELRKEFTDKINELKADHKTEIELMRVEFSKITLAKDQRIEILEEKVKNLQTEVAKYKGMGEHAAEILHQKVDEAKEEIMK